MAISDAVREAGLERTALGEKAAFPTLRRSGFYAVAKRVFDVVFSGLALLVLFPLFVVVSACVAATSGLPVIYRQARIGKGGKTIYVFKFRTMVRNADALLQNNPELLKSFKTNYKLKDDRRITPVGRVLRKTSIDELPQLINVFLGQMSIVGPRPIVEDELERYGEFKNLYLAMTPGCAGLWQCSGRNDLPYEQRVALDTEYFWKAGFAFDLCLVARTFVAVITRRGAC